MTRNYSRETGSMTGIFEELKWENLQLRRGGMIIGPYDCKKVCQVKSKFMQMTLCQNRRFRNQHEMAYQISYASIDTYKKSFSPQTIRDWNYLPDPLISAAELSDNCVSKFTSLLRARFLGQALTRYCHFGVSSVTYSDKMRDVKSANHGTWIPNGNSRCYH